MKKTIIPIAAALVAVLPARAQQPESDLNRQMDVTRDYEPRVRKADKLGIAPNMVDTVALRPEVHYEVHPSPINYGFDVTPIKPVQRGPALRSRACWTPISRPRRRPTANGASS